MRPTATIALLMVLAHRGHAQAVEEVPQHLRHEVRIGLLRECREERYARTLAQYDEHLARHPDDVLVHIEKCLFIESALQSDDEDHDTGGREADPESCHTALAERFPGHPKALLHRISRTWGDGKEAILGDAIALFEAGPGEWGDADAAALFRAAAEHYQGDDDWKALRMIERAVTFGQDDRGSLLRARILMAVDRRDDAREALTMAADTTEEGWELQQRGLLLLELGDHPEALRMFQRAERSGGHAVDHQHLAKVHEGIGEHGLARGQLVLDTARLWRKEQAIRALFRHDMRHQPADSCLASYNALRGMGYSMDPLAMHRLRLFFRAPALPWQARDLLGLLVLGLVIAVMLALPSAWVLPVLVAGLRWPRLRGTPLPGARWGLRSFWWAGSAFLLASLLSFFPVPEAMDTWFGDAGTGEEDIGTGERGRSMLVFLLCFAAGVLVLWRGMDPGLLLPRAWAFWPTVSRVGGVFLLYKLAVGAYIRIGSGLFDAEVPFGALDPCGPLAASREDVQAFLGTYGKAIGFLVMALLVPVYEEIAFRGVVMAACTRWIGFARANWVQSFLFAIIHDDLFLFPCYLAFGLVVGVMTKRSGSLFAGILFHMLNNALAIAVIGPGGL